MYFCNFSCGTGAKRVEDEGNAISTAGEKITL